MLRNYQSPCDEGRVDGRRVALKFFGYFSETPTFRAKSLGSLYVESESCETMNSSVASLGGKFQVIVSVVFFVLILVVNFFSLLKLSTKSLFHLVAMNFNTLAVDIDATISGTKHRLIFADRVVAAQDGTEKCGVAVLLALSNIPTWPLERLLATGTDKVYKHSSHRVSPLQRFTGQKHRSASTPLCFATLPQFSEVVYA